MEVLKDAVVLVDLDDVITDFDRALFDELVKLNPELASFPFKEREHYNLWDNLPERYHPDIKAIRKSFELVASLPAVEGAIEAVKEIADLAQAVFICSSPITNYESSVLPKYLWVDDNFGSNWVNRLVLTRDKTLIYGDFLIDDKPEVEGISLPSWEHIIYDQPYNRDVVGKRRLHWQNWREVLGA